MHDQFDVTLEDGDLLGEVELTTTLIIAASESEEHLSQEEIDRLLGVTPRKPLRGLTPAPTRLSRSRRAPARWSGPTARTRPSLGRRSSVTSRPSELAVLDGEAVGEVAALTGCRARCEPGPRVGVAGCVVGVLDLEHRADVAAGLAGPSRSR